MTQLSWWCVIYAIRACKCVWICIFLCVISIPTEKKGLVVMISKRLLGLVKWGFLSACASLSLFPSLQPTLCLVNVQVEVKPYVLDDQLCDECQGARCGGKFAPFFCANVTCLQYYCEFCWANIHSRAGREFHKPLVKEGADRPRQIHFRWN